MSRRHQEGAEDADERGGEAVHHADAAVWWLNRPNTCRDQACGVRTGARVICVVGRM